MRRVGFAVGARVRAAAIVLALVGSLLPLSSVLAVPIVTPATGGGAISADQFGTSNYTSLTGPSISENGVGALANGSTTILNVPAGFQFNPASGNVSITGAGCNLTGTLAMTTTTATFTVTQASTVATCVVNFVGLQVQPTAGAGAASGNITKTGTSSAPAGATNYGTLTKVAGAVTQVTFTQQPSPTTNGGVVFAQQPIVRAQDQFGNNSVNTPVQLAIAAGTGAAGAALTCTTNPRTTNGSGLAIFAGCRIDKAGNYRLNASVGSANADSGLFIIAVGPATGLRFQSYPVPAGPPVLAPQPEVAIVDAGGNTVTTATNTVTIAINQNPGTFTCTGGTARPAVNGVATFTGCTQTVVANNYSLTATSNTPTPSVVGPLFAITPPSLLFVAGPGSPNAGSPFPTNVQVKIDNGGVTQVGISATITLAIGTNPGGGTLTCPGGNTVPTNAGVATFAGCRIDKAGNGYTLIATASNVLPTQAVNPGVSAPFNVLPPLPAASLSITASRSVIVWGESILLTVQLGGTGAANRQVMIEVSRSSVGQFFSIATLTTDANGRASFTYRPANNNYYRANFLGAPDLGGAISPLTRVVVRQIALLRPTNNGTTKTIQDGTTITFRTTVRPSRPDLPQAHVTYEVYRRVGAAWSRIIRQTVAVNSAGVGSLGVSFTATGRYYVRSLADPTTFNANSAWSAPERYNVV